MKVTINKNFSLSSDDLYSNVINMHKNMSDSSNYITENIYPNLGLTYGRTASFESGKIEAVEGDKGWLDFFKDWKEEGFWQAMYDKSFIEVCGDFFKELFRDMGLLIVANGDLIFLIPAIGLIFITFFIGRNKYTRYIIPLLFGYFGTTVWYRMLLQ